MRKLSLIDIEPVNRYIDSSLITIRKIALVFDHDPMRDVLQQTHRTTTASIYFHGITVPIVGHKLPPFRVELNPGYNN